MNIAEWVQRNGRIYADQSGIALGARTYLTHRQWAARARSIAGYLRNRVGCEAGDRVALIMANTPAYLEALFGIWHAGLVAVPVNARLHPREFAYVLAHSGARAAFVGAELAEIAGALADATPGVGAIIVPGTAEWERALAAEAIDLVDRRPDDIAWLFYTSGTTGQPKGACLTQRNLLTMSLSYFADIDHIAPEDSVLHAAPLSHGSGLYGLPHVARGATSILPESPHFDGTEVAEILKTCRGMSFFAAPTMVNRLIANPAFAASDHANLKTIVYGGAPMYVEDLKRALALLGPRLCQIYGQGESPMTITALSKAMHAESAHSRWETRLASVGTIRTDVEVRIVDGEDRAVATGESGEVAVRGDVVMAGYFNDVPATAVALRNGWLHTGDVGHFDEEGILTLHDRVKDIIISGGSNIYPREVEEVLLRHPAVEEVSVIGRPDPEWGEAVIAVVVPRVGQKVNESELDALCLSSIARFKRPKAYIVADELPKNSYGKVLKRELRARFLTDRS